MRYINTFINLPLFCVFIMSFFFTAPLFAQQPEADVNRHQATNVIPPSPTAAAFAKYSNFPVNMANGVPNISIPIHTVAGDGVSIPISLDLFDEGNSFEQASDFMQFTASISSFSMLLRDSQYKGTSSYNQVVNWLDNTSLTDQYNFKAQLRDLVQQASGF